MNLRINIELTKKILIRLPKKYDWNFIVNQYLDVFQNLTIAK